MKEIDKKILQYNKFNLSWFGRVAMCKMMLLPKLNFLFDALPIKHTEKELEKYQNVINRFCNGKRKARIPKILWYISQKEGGLGIPNISKYYRAFQLRNVIKLLIREEPIWGKLESKEFSRKGKAFFLCGDKDKKNEISG